MTDEVDGKRIDARISSLVESLGLAQPPPVPALFDLSAAEYPDSQKALKVIPEIARLLLLRGDPPALGGALAASFLIHSLERVCKEGYARSSLFKGLAQIGLGKVSLGIRNTVRARAEGGGLDSPDMMLSDWGVASAAVAIGELGLAAEFLASWESRARKLSNRAEVERAGAAREALAAIVDSLDHAEVAAARDRLLPTGGPPLLLGVGDHPGPPTDEHWSIRGGFSDIVHARVEFARRRLVDPLDASEIAVVCERLAAWNLARPLQEATDLLAELDAPTHFSNSMSRLLGSHAAGHALPGSGFKALGTPRVGEAVIWMTDVHGYSSLSERVAPPVLFETLSPLFDIMNEELEAAGGMVLEFVGDSIMVVFDAFEGQSSKPSEILSATARCLERLHTRGVLAALTGRPVVGVGVGISRGEVAVGYLGGLRRCHLSTLGNTVNVTARIEALTRRLPSVVAVEESFFGKEPPAVWSAPSEVGYSLRDLGAHSLKNIDKPSRVYGLGPLLARWVDFVPMGFVAEPEPGILYLDVGNRCEPGVVDHHFEEGLGSCACEIVCKRPELVLGHLEGTPDTEIELRVHATPDLDCAASYYAASEWLDDRRTAASGGSMVRVELLRELSRYVGLIDQGRFPDFEHYSDSLYGVFQAHTQLFEESMGRRATDRERLSAGVRVVDAAMFIAQRDGERTGFSRIFESEPGWFSEEREWLRNDYERYRIDRDRALTYEAPVGGSETRLPGLWLNRPSSVLFKVWARNAPEAPGGKGWPWIAVDWSDDGKQRFVFSVDPESGLHLAGLGQTLESAETERRAEVGKPRETNPRRYPADNADPWYFGQGHSYTIVDSPNRGTVLSSERVQEIHRAWKPESR